MQAPSQPDQRIHEIGEEIRRRQQEAVPVGVIVQTVWAVVDVVVLQRLWIGGRARRLSGIGNEQE